jgi:hypothetical protein
MKIVKRLQNKYNQFKYYDTSVYSKDVDFPAGDYLPAAFFGFESHLITFMRELSEKEIKLVAPLILADRQVEIGYVPCAVYFFNIIGYTAKNNSVWEKNHQEDMALLKKCGLLFEFWSYSFIHDELYCEMVPSLSYSSDDCLSPQEVRLYAAIATTNSLGTCGIPFIKTLPLKTIKPVWGLEQYS